jgi:hypothetical protein
MDQIQSMFSDMWDWLSSPFRKDLPISQLALIIVVYVIIAFILYDSVKILGQWMAQAGEVAADIVEGA